MKSVEIKAAYKRNKKTEALLKKLEARCVETGKQTDTYFKVDIGGLMIREFESGSSKLIHYYREEEEGPRVCHYEIVTLKRSDRIREMLEGEHGVRAVVMKNREVWEYENMRIHFDEVEGLGNFIELQAVLEDGGTVNEGKEKVSFLMDVFGITQKHLIYQSYEEFTTQPA